MQRIPINIIPNSSSSNNKNYLDNDSSSASYYSRDNYLNKDNNDRSERFYPEENKTLYGINQQENQNQYQFQNQYQNQYKPIDPHYYRNYNEPFYYEEINSREYPSTRFPINEYSYNNSTSSSGSSDRSTFSIPINSSTISPQRNYNSSSNIPSTDIKPNYTTSTSSSSSIPKVTGSSLEKEAIAYQPISQKPIESKEIIPEKPIEGSTFEPTSLTNTSSSTMMNPTTTTTTTKAPIDGLSGLEKSRGRRYWDLAKSKLVHRNATTTTSAGVAPPVTNKPIDFEIERPERVEKREKHGAIGQHSRKKNIYHNNPSNPNTYSHLPTTTTTMNKKDDLKIINAPSESEQRRKILSKKIFRP